MPAVISDAFHHFPSACLAAIVAWVCGIQSVPAAEHSAGAGLAVSRPNVLMIAVDDLNDWVGCLGGHPQAQTPHLDQLAAESVLFTNAHCQAPICNPSRVSLLTGTRPSTTGVYYLGPLLRDCVATRQAVSLPEQFARHGYTTLGAGKIFHADDAREFQQYGGQFGGFGPRPQINLHCGHVNPLWDWGPFPADDDEMPDVRLAKWTAAQLRNELPEPFFLACGFYRPHVPLYVPPSWFARFPLESIHLPSHLANDLSDVPAYGQDLSWSAVAPRHTWMVTHDHWRRAVQAYLASVCFVDAQIGKVLAALKASGRADSTWVVLWSDHGFHLGTKERWGKRSLWEPATRVVLMIRPPGGRVGARCDRPVGLIDLYPTLNELCELAPVHGLEGQSLVPLLNDPQRPWTRPVLTSFGPHNHAVRAQDWRYITYADGSEELYDHRQDPQEYTNLANHSEHAAVIAELRRWLPQINQPLAPGSIHCDARPGSAPDIDGAPDFPGIPVQFPAAEVTR